MSKRPGLVQIYHGTGKGKTTAAFGLALRAAGSGLRVCIIQFMKETVKRSGEFEAVKNVNNIDIFRFGGSFIDKPPKPAGVIKERIEEGIAFANKAVTGNDYDVVILDEINVALYFQLAELNDVLELIAFKKENIELILTGRYPPEELLDRADLITEMNLVKHPYDKGVRARRGIEY